MIASPRALRMINGGIADSGISWNSRTISAD
jgi:hypothetical protein